MNCITNYRAVFLKKDGNFINYPIVLGNNHPIVIEDYCKKMNYSFPSIETIIKNNDIVFLNANNGIVIAYLPKEITEKQYFALDLLSINMNDIVYMEVRKEGNHKDFIFKENIGEQFSKEVIQSYFEEKGKIK